MSVYVAKMTTRYPDFHGEGYYNFLMDETRGGLEAKIERQIHDFRLEDTAELDYDSVEELVADYPSKEKLNKAVFDV